LVLVARIQNTSRAAQDVQWDETPLQDESDDLHGQTRDRFTELSKGIGFRRGAIALY